MGKDIKFKLTTETKVNLFGVKLFRIEATCDIKERGVKKGEKGGWVESKEVNGNARVSGNAWVSGDAEVYGNAEVSGNAEVFGNARVSGNAWVFGNARVYGDAEVYGNAWVFGNARVYGDAWVYGDAEVYGNAWVFGNDLDTGYCFAYKNNDWNVTEVPTKDGSGVLLIKDYKAPEKLKETR